MTALLERLIEEAYVLFAPYRLGKELVVCTGCCLSKQDEKLLLTTPLREISAYLMFQYLDAAVSDYDLQTLTTETKYFLPRILDLMTQRAFLSNDDDLILQKRCFFQKTQHWMPEEISYMQRFALAYFEWKLLNPDQQGVEDSPLLVFHLAGLDIQPLLDNWFEHCHDHNAIYSFVGMVSDLLLDGEIFYPFADDLILLKVKTWLKDERVRYKFRAAILQSNSASQADYTLGPYYQMVVSFLEIASRDSKVLSRSLKK